MPYVRLLLLLKFAFGGVAVMPIGPAVSCMFWLFGRWYRPILSLSFLDLEFFPPSDAALPCLLRRLLPWQNPSKPGITRAVSVVWRVEMCTA